MDAVNLQEVYNAFAASSSHLFRFVMNYRYHKEVDTNGKILYFCQIASQYADGLDWNGIFQMNAKAKYPEEKDLEAAAK